MIAGGNGGRPDSKFGTNQYSTWLEGGYFTLNLKRDEIDVHEIWQVEGRDMSVMRLLVLIVSVVLLISNGQGLAEPRSQFNQNSLDEYVHEKDEVYECRLVRSERRMATKVTL